MARIQYWSRRVGLLALAGGLTSACGATEAAPTSGVELIGAWARTSAPGATTGAVYLTILSHDTDHLEGFEIAPTIAGAAELHQMVAADGSVVAGTGGSGSGGMNMAGMSDSAMDHGGDDDGVAGSQAPPLPRRDQPMRMAPVTGGLAIPSGRDIVLGPGGYHVMLDDLAQPLSAGDTFELTVRFARAGNQPVEVEVRDAPP